MTEQVQYKPLGGTIFTRGLFVLLFFTIIGFSLIAVRFWKGIGAVSNMTDVFPLGIWITYDVATGTALACGGYAIALLVYILNGWHYHSLMRSAILLSFFGYILAGFSVVTDLGRFWNVYNIFMPSRWQFNSALLEVALCIMTYCLVLFIEFLPVILEWIRGLGWGTVSKFADRFAPKLDRVLIYFIVLGMTLPTMHQSSLGSLFLIATSKVHPIWHTMYLPLFFLLNCLFLGYGVVVIESTLSSYIFDREYEVRDLAGLAGTGAWIATMWLTLRVADLAWRGRLGMAFAGGDRYSLSFLIEFLLVAFGTLFLFNPKLRSPRWLFISGVLLIVGGGLYRFNVYLIGFNWTHHWKYFPSLAEFLITMGIIAFEFLAYFTLVKILPVLPAQHKPHPAGRAWQGWQSKVESRSNNWHLP